MSRSTMQISHEPYYEPVRDVFLNRDGKKIGQIVRWIGKSVAYLSWRTQEHYFIKYMGFGIDRALLWNLLANDRVDLIVIEYKGVRGSRWFVSHVDDWVIHGIEVQYNKEKGKTVETYGVQKILCSDYMDELELKIAW